MATDKPRFSVTFEEELFDQIEDYRHENKISTRSKAVVELVEKGIDSLVHDNPELSSIIKNAPDISSEAMRLAAAFDRADEKSKDFVRLALKEYIVSPRDNTKEAVS